VNGFFHGENFVAGVAYYWQAKVYEFPSMWGVRDGRVSRLTIWRAKYGDDSGEPIFSWDRGGHDEIDEAVLDDILFTATGGAEGKVHAA